MLELNQRPTLHAPRVRREANKQPRRLLLALALLVIALVAVILRDSQFWFGSDESALDADTSSTQVVRPTPTQPATVHPATKSAPAAAKKSVVAKGKAEPVAATAAAPTPADSGAVVNRTVLPPMDVEIVAGDNHRVLRPGNNATKVEISKAASAVAQSAPVTNAADREPMALATSIPAQGAYEATYPLLAQHMNVQGSVVLQAVIGSDGIIENMRVLAGPAILASAAQQAVREWHFKPILQNGQPVESKARITVNFTIRVADSSANPTLAESRAEDIRVISR
jgi:periplasmic protein TonB